jgi:hypothetical protein
MNSKVEFQFYKEPWPISEHPISPPNRECKWGKETESSKLRTAEWIYRQEEYYKNIWTKLEEKPIGQEPVIEQQLKSEKEPGIINRYELMDLD